jgi:hypothetical protein
VSVPDFKSSVSTSRELLSFMWQGKNWWLTPIVVIVLLMSGLVVFLQSSAIAPFIYALF